MRTGDGERIRRQKFSELLRTGWFVALLVVVPAIVLVLAAAYGNALVAIGAAAAAAGLTLLAGYGHATEQARDAVLSGFAAARGLTFVDAMDPPPLTPLLVAGDERKMDCAMHGAVEAMPLTLGHFTYTEITRSTDSDGNTRTDRHDHDFTVALTDVDDALTQLPTLHLRPRSNLPGWGSGWLNTRGLEKAETESVRFNERFKVWHRESQDPMVLRRLLDPSVIDTLANQALPIGVELSAGTLLVYVKGHCSDSGELAALVDVLGYLRRCVLDAARPPVVAPAPVSQGPPV